MSSIESVQKLAEAEIEGATTTAELSEIESRFLGKSGQLTSMMRELGNLPKEERPAFGAAINQAKTSLQSILELRFSSLKNAELSVQFQREALDITMPSRAPRRGHRHVLQQTTDRIKEIFSGMGFTYKESPELELFKYNFDALNYPPDHPAMDDQDTFFIDSDYLLRTQCTALQGRVFENVKPPLRFFTVGRTFRNESVDRTHSHTFHQVDVFMIDKGVSMADLKGTLGLFAREMFGADVKVRFRPDFFPFVEPGVDYAISSPKVFGGRWLELGGAGLIHPSILERFGIDPQEYSGFAFGLGVERIPMLARGIDDLRNFLENDLRFLEQFPN